MVREILGTAKENSRVRYLKRTPKLERGKALAIPMRNEISALKARIWAALACAMLVALSSNGFGESATSTDVALKARAAYTQAQRQFQQELADFLATRRPDLKHLILVSRDEMF